MANSLPITDEIIKKFEKVDTYSYGGQVGAPGHYHLAQVFGLDGESVATFDATDNPQIASDRARLLCAALEAARRSNRNLRKPIGTPANVSQ